MICAPKPGHPFYAEVEMVSFGSAPPHFKSVGWISTKSLPFCDFRLQRMCVFFHSLLILKSIHSSAATELGCCNKRKASSDKIYRPFIAPTLKTPNLSAINFYDSKHTRTHTLEVLKCLRALRVFFLFSSCKTKSVSAELVCISQGSEGEDFKIWGYGKPIEFHAFPSLKSTRRERRDTSDGYKFLKMTIFQRPCCRSLTRWNECVSD